MGITTQTQPGRRDLVGSLVYWFFLFFFFVVVVVFIRGRVVLLVTLELEAEECGAGGSGSLDHLWFSL